MKADLTRNTFRAGKHYRSVRMQQGRVQLDADWNEQQDILDHRIETESTDVLGPLAAPADGTGFQLGTLAPGMITIGKGRIYVDGVMCENELDALALDQQPDLPASACVIVNGQAQALPAPAGLYLGFIHVWQRHLTALEDPAIREMALGGPDTATRVKTLWQVQLLQASSNPAAPLGCLSSIPAWDSLIQAPNGQLAARAEPSPDPSNPCKLSPTAGYRRLDNLLYRVEVHLMPGLDPAFKWSHDNGSIESSWLSATPGAQPKQLDLGVATLGRDPVLSFAPGQWVELFDDTTELLGRPGTLVKVVEAEGTTVTVDITAAQIFPAGAPTDIANFPANPRLRRWDGWGFVKGATAASVSGGWFELEDGVQIKFKWQALGFRHGDYWTFAARTATQVAGAGVEWPIDAGGEPLYQAQEGGPHGWGRLAMLAFDGSAWSVVSDCRPLFPSLTELTQLSYVGGDAQTVFEGEPLTLPRPLEVGVSMGALPAGVASVRFTVESGTLPNGTTTQDVLLAPADKGIAKLPWTLAANLPHQYARAELLEGGGPSATHFLPVHFSASIADDGDCACTVCVSPQAQAAESEALQKAIDTVVKRGGGVVCLDVGIYPIRKALRISRATNVVLRGKGGASRLVGPGALLLVDQSTDVRVEALSLNSTGTAEIAALGVQDTGGFVLVDVQILVDAAGAQGVALFVTGKLSDLRLQQCEFAAPVGIAGGAMPGAAAVNVTLEGLDVADCRFACANTGVWLSLNDFSRPVRIQRCRFEQSSFAALLINGSSSVGTPVELVGNSVQVSGLGLLVGAPSVRILGNHVAGVAQKDEVYGIAAVAAAQPSGDFQLLDNHISGFATGIYVVQPPARTRIAGNQIRDGRIGISVISTTTPSDAVVAIESNQISDLGIPAYADAATTEAISGIFVFGARAAHIAGNTLRRIGVAATAAGTTILGAVGYNCARIQLSDNDVVDLAPPGSFAGVAVGVGAFLPYLDVDLVGNRVRRSATSAAGDTSLWGGLYGGPQVLAQAPGKSVASLAKRTQAKAASVLPKAVPISHFSPIIKISQIVLPPLVQVVVPGSTAGTPSAPAATTRPTALPEAVSVLARGNQVAGLGLGSCVALTGTSVTFVDNQCQRLTGQLTTSQTLAAPVILFGFALTASHNVIDGAEDRQFGGATFTSMQLTTFGDGRVTVLGNHTSGQIMVGNAVLAAPWAPLNVFL